MNILNLSTKQVITGLKELAEDVNEPGASLNTPAEALEKGYYLVRHLNCKSKVGKFTYWDNIGQNYNIIELAFTGFFGKKHQCLLRDNCYFLSEMESMIAEDNDTWFNKYDTNDEPDNDIKQEYQNRKKAVNLIKHSSSPYFIEDIKTEATHTPTVKDAEFLLNRAADVVKYVAQLTTHIPEDHGEVEFTESNKSSQNMIISMKLFNPKIQINRHNKKRLSILNSVR